MPDLDRELFNKRLKRLYAQWQSNTDNIDAICVVTGGDSESSYYKTTAIQQWLFCVEISDTAILFLDNTVVFVASPKKIAFLKQVEGSKENDSIPKYKFINREKTDSEKTFLKEAIETLKKSHNGRKIGVFPKDKYDGEFIKDWNKAVDQGGFEKFDASHLISSILAVKDDAELNCIKKACEITSKIYSKHLKVCFQVYSIIN